MGWLYTTALRSYSLAAPTMMLLYPLYASIMAIESPYKEDDQQWLTYWVLYSLVSLVELAAWRVLAWIPFYATAKLLIASWLVLPQFRGGIILYEKFVRPYLQKNVHAGSTGGQLSDGERKWLGSVTPDAQAAVTAFIRENGADNFDAFIQAETKNIKSEKKSSRLGSISSDAEAAAAKFIRENGADKFDELLRKEKKKQEGGSSSDSD